MSWAADEWKDGLPQRALSKITEIEAHLERLKKERDQKQFKVESLEQALEVQKRKGTNEKSDVARLERENQTLVETCKQLELKKEKLVSELELKEAQVTGLEVKVAELCSTVPAKITEPVSHQVQGSDPQSDVIRSLEQEIAELRKQVEDKHDATNTSARPSSGDEGSSTKSLRHMSEAEQLRQTMMEMRTLHSLVTELEGKNKKLIQEGECARHNAEAARLHLEVKMKESEKDLKRDLAHALEAAKNAERVLQESKVKWQQEINAAHAEQSKMKGLLEKLETENGRVVREHDDLTKQLAATEDAMKNNNARVAEADKKKIALEAEKQSLASELEHKTREVEAQSAEFTKLKIDIGQREQANNTLKGQLMDRTLESDKFKVEAAAASQKLVLAENQLMELQKLQQKTDDRIKEMSLSLNQLQKEKETLEGSSMEQAKQLQKVQEEFQLVSASLKDTQTQLAQVESHFTESQNKWNDLERTLRHELSQSASSVDVLIEQKISLENQLSVKDLEIVELRNQCEASERKVSSKDEELSQKSQNIIELEKQLDTLQEQHEVLKKEHHQQEMLAKEKMAQLEMTVIEKTQELEMFVIQSAQDKTVLETTTEKLLEEKQTLQLEIHSCRFECESSKMLNASLNEEIKTLKEILECRDMSLVEMNVVIQNKDQELHEKKEENGVLSTGVNQRDQEIQSMKEKLVSMEKELEVSQKELQVVNERCEGLESGTASFISQIEECRRQEKCREQVKEQLEKQVADLQSQFDLSQSECSTLSEQVRCGQGKVALLEKNVDSLHSKCSELEAQASAWEADLGSKAAICGQLEAQCLQLSENLHSQKAENSDLISKSSSLETQLAEFSKLHLQTVAALHQQIQEAQKGSDEFKSLLGQRDNLVSELESEISRLKNGTAGLESVCLSQKVDIEERVALICSLEKTCDSLRGELDVVKLTVVEKDQQLCSQLDNLSQMEKRMRQLEEEKKALEMTTEQLEVLQTELLQNSQDLSQKALRVTELEDQVRDLSNRLSAAQKEAAESDAKHAQEMGALKSKLDMLEMDVEDSVGQVKDLNEKVSDLTSLLEKTTQERDGLKENLQQLNEEVGELRMNLESEQACLVQVKQERDRLTEETGNLKTQLEQMSSVIHSLEEKHACLSDELRASQMKVEEQEHIICSHLEDLSQKKNSMKQLEEEKQALERTTEQIDVLQKELLKYSQDLSQNTSRTTELEGQVEDLTSKLSQAQKEALDIEAKYAHESGTLKSKLDMLEMDVEDSDGQVKDLNEKVSDLTSLLEKVTQERGRLKESLQQLNEEVGELKMNLESEQACLVQVKQERDRLTEENSSLKSTLVEMQTELDKKHSLYEEWDLLLGKIQKDNEELIKKLQDCEAERDLLIHRSKELDQALSEEKALVVAKTEEADILNQNCSLLSNKLHTVTEQLSEQVLEASSRTQSLQAVECQLRELESSSLMHEERIQKEVEELKLLVLQREESLAETEKVREELECVVEDLKCKLSQAEQMNFNGVLQHEQNVAIVQSQLEMLQRDVEDKNCMVEQLKDKICDLESLIEKVVQEKEEMHEAEKAIRSGALELESALEEERQNVAGVKLNENSLNERIKYMDSALTDVRHQLEEKEKLLQTLQEQFKSVNNNSDEMEKQFSEERRQLSAAMEELQLCLSIEKQAGQSTTLQLEAASHRCTELTEVLDNKTSELEAASHRCTELTELLDNKTSELETATYRCTELTELLDNKTSELEAASHRCTELTELLDNKTSELETATYRCTELTELIDNKTSELETATYRCTELTELLDNKTSELETATYRCTELTELLDNKTSELETATYRCTELTELLDNKTSELEATTHRCTDLTELLDNLKAELSQIQTELESQVQSQEMLNCKLRDQEEELMRLKKASHEDMQQLQKNFLESQVKLNQRTSTVEDLEKQIVDMSDKFDNVQREKDEENVSHRQEAARLRSQLEMLQMDYESEDCEVKELNAKISNLESEIERVVSEKVKMAEVLAALNAEFLQLKTIFDVEREKATQAKMSEDTLKDRIQFLEASLSAVKLEKQDKENCLQNLQSEYETAKEMIVKNEKMIKEYQIDQENANTMIKNGHQAFDEQKLLVEAKTMELKVVQERYAAVLEELEEMRSVVASKQDEVDVWAQEVEQLENKINQLETEKEIIRDELSREQLQKLPQSRRSLQNESLMDLRTSKEELNVLMADEQCENGVLNSEEEVLLKGQQDMLEVNVKVQEDNGSDWDTTMSSLKDQPENLGDDKPNLKGAYQPTNCETELVHDGSGNTDQGCLDIMELTERQKENIEHLKSSLLTIREALLENGQGFTGLVQRAISQNIIRKMRYGLDTDMNDLERMLVSVQHIVDFLIIDDGGQSSEDSHLLGQSAAEGPELTSSQEHSAEIEDSHLNSYKETLKENVREHSEMQIEHGNTLNVEGIDLLQETCCKVRGERTSDSWHQEQELTKLTSTMDELQNEIEQKNKMINELVNKKTDLETVLSAVNDQNSKLQTTKASLESENSLLQESHVAAKEETVRLTSEMQSLLAAVAELENVLIEKAAYVECGQQEIVKLEQKLAEAVDNCENLKLALSQKTDQISLLETTIRHLESQIDIMENEKSIQAKSVSQEAETIPLQLSSMKEDLEARDTELEQLKAQFDEVSRALVKSNSRLAELQVEKTNLSEQMENVEKLTKSYLQERDNTINILREELDSAAQENDALKTDKGEWQTREDKYKQEISDLDVKLSDLNMEVVSTRESFESVSNQRFEAQGKLNRALQEQKNLEGRFQKMEVELAEAKRLVENVQILELKLKELEEAVVAKDEEMKFLKEQLNEMCISGVGESDSLQKQKEDLERCLLEANERNGALGEQLNEVTSVMNDMKEQLAQLQELMQTLNNSVDSKRKEIIQRVNEICEKNDEISQLKAVVEENEKVNKEMSNEICERNDEISQLKAAVEENEKMNKEMSNEICERNDEISQLKAVVEENEKVNKEMSNEICERNDEISQLKAAIEENEKVNKEMSNEICERNDEISQLKAAVEENEKVNKEMSNEICERNDEISQLKAAVEENEKVNKEMSNEICERNDEISQLKAVVEEKEKVNKEMSNQMTNIQKEASSTLGTLQDALESLNFELQAAEEEKMALAGENEILKKESQELQEKMKTLMNGNLKEGCSGGESRTLASHQDLATLQDAIESLNFDLKAVEEERDALASENEVLKKTSIDLCEKIQKLIQDDGTSSEEDLSEQTSCLEKLISDLTLHVHSLGKKNNDMKKQLDNELKVTLDLSAQVQTLNEQLHEKITLSENIAVQVDSLTADVSFSVKQLSEKEEELWRSNEVEKSLNGRVLELYNQITSLQLDLDCKNDQMEKLKDEHENILIKCQELESVIVQLQEDLKQELQASKAVKENLQTKEMVAAKFEQLIQDYNSAIIDRDHLRSRVEMLARVESDKQKVEEELKLELDKQSVLEQKLQELEKELVRQGNLDEMSEAAELERNSLRETVEKVELDNQLMRDKVEEMEKEVEDLMQEKDLCEKKVAKLQFGNCGLEEKVKELNKIVDNLVNEKASLQDNVMKLESCNAEFKDRLRELNQKADNLTTENASLQTEIKKLDSSKRELDEKIDNLTTENMSLQTEIKKLDSSKCQLEDKLNEFDQIIKDSALEKVSLQDDVMKLQSSNCEAKDKLKELDKIIENAAVDKVSLQDEVKKLQSNNCQLEDKINEFDQIIEDAAIEKVILQDKVKKLEGNNCQLEGKLKELDQIIEDAAIEKVLLQDKVHALESSNFQLEDKLKELIQNMEDTTLEKESLQDKLNKLESARHKLEDELKATEVGACEYEHLKQKFELQEKNLTEKLQELSRSVEEKAHLESQLKDLQNERSQTANTEGSNSSVQINEQHKELLRKWEQRCSDLSAQLAMDRKKIQRLTEQVEKLKSSKEVDIVEDNKLQALKEELDEVKQERDVCQDKYAKMCEAAERHYNKSKDLQSVNEKLSSRNKLLNALLKGEKPRMIVPVIGGSHSFGAQKLHTTPGAGGSTEAATTIQLNSRGPLFAVSEHGLPSCGSKQMEPGMKLSESVTGNRAVISKADAGKSESILDENQIVSLDTKDKLISDADTVKAHMVLEEDNKMSSHTKEKLISDAVSVQAPGTSQINNKLSLDTKEIPKLSEDSQNIAEVNDHANPGTGLYSTRSSTRLKLRSPKAQSVQKSRINSPKSAIPPQLVLSTQKEIVEFISNVVPSLSKIQSPKDLESSLSKLKTQSSKVVDSPSKLKKQTFDNVSVFKAVNVPSKILQPSTCTSKILEPSTCTSKVSHPFTSSSTITANRLGQELNVKQPQSSDVTDQLKPIPSPRVSRRMSLQKRRSTDQSSELAGGKKSKLSLQEPVPETRSITGGKTSAQTSRLPQPASTRTGQATGLPRPMRTRSRQDTLASQGQNALATITNSPKKTPSQESKLTRTSRARARNVTTAQAQAAQEGASDCTIN